MPNEIEATNSRSPSTFVLGLQESPLIDIILRRHPQETVVERLNREFIRTSKDMTISILKQFLGKKLSYQPYTHFQVWLQIFRIFDKSKSKTSRFIDHQILTTAGGKSVVIDDDITLGLVQRDICDNPEYEIILHFRVLPTNGV